MYRTPTGRPTFPGIGVIGVKSWQKTRKNRGQSASGPRCLNAEAVKREDPRRGMVMVDDGPRVRLHAARAAERRLADFPDDGRGVRGARPATSDFAGRRTGSCAARGSP